MNKLLILCGPTSSGKTDRALAISKFLGASLVCADSRQVYRGFEFLTGKDIPSGFTRYPAQSSTGVSLPFFSDGRTDIWMTDFVDPSITYDASSYVSTARNVLFHIWKQKKLPIVTAGTGLYVRLLTQPGLANIHIPPNLKLRKKLGNATALELAAHLKRIDRSKFFSMNASDRANPRRLVRAMEVTAFSGHTPRQQPLVADILWIGLATPAQVLSSRIEKRVMMRWDHAVDEVRYALAGCDSYKGVQTSIGFKQVASFLAGKITKEEALSTWITKEKQYAKRQMTWFGKQREILWFDTQSNNVATDIIERVQTWYTGF